MDSHFSRVRISNFDLFHHQCAVAICGIFIVIAKLFLIVILRITEIVVAIRWYRLSSDQSVMIFILSAIFQKRTWSPILKRIRFWTVCLLRNVRKNVRSTTANVWCSGMTYEAESDFCMAVSNSLLKNYKGQIDTKFSASYQYKRIAIRSKKQLWTDDIEHIVECLSKEFEK